jgi:hypothetical protein
MTPARLGRATARSIIARRLPLSSFLARLRIRLTPCCLPISEAESGPARYSRSIASQSTLLRSVISLPLFGFADYGAAWNPAGAPYKFASLGSAGFRVRTGIGERLIGTVLLAQPLTYDSKLATLGVRQSTRVRFTLGLQF